jgi:hypothetical protein
MTDKPIVGTDVFKGRLDASVAGTPRASLIADLPELGVLTAKQIAALLGLAPHTRRSGTIRYREPTGHAAPVCATPCSMPPALRSATLSGLLRSAGRPKPAARQEPARGESGGRADRRHAPTRDHRQRRRPRSPALARHAAKATAAGGRHEMPTARDSF